MNNLENKTMEELLVLLRIHASSEDNDFAEQLFCEDIAEIKRRSGGVRYKVNNDNFIKYQNVFYSVYNFFKDNGYFEEYGDTLSIKCRSQISSNGTVVITCEDLDFTRDDLEALKAAISDVDNISVSIYDNKISILLRIFNVWKIEGGD